MTELLKCCRCRWVGIKAELRSVPNPKDCAMSHNVCPRCGCKSFTDAQEPKNG
ncbi:hypothetical protein [Stutzerimonas kirkiae]|uniref:hypothetical protein n=1 Tax=Stutzerimonas kirkiae TaxID=2211392 RepID=UPI0013F16D74|nr:hypothetical protein [Stutzerimonas kirkiae]